MIGYRIKFVSSVTCDMDNHSRLTRNQTMNVI